jgi:hypothetical protein
MAQNSQQFTSAQILEAGQRAEVEGRLEYAIQFYRHLTDHLPRSPEAAIAREALSKLGALPSGSERTAPAQTNGSAGPSYYTSASPLPNNGNGLPNSGNGAVPPPQQYARPTGTAIVPRRPQPNPSAANTAAPKPVFSIPKSKRRYRTGRFFARFFSVLGFLQMGVGVGLMIAALLSQFGGGIAMLPAIIASQSPMLAGGAGSALLFFGSVQVLGGQLARAIFDQASASRDLALFNRARAAYDAGAPAPQPEED